MKVKRIAIALAALIWLLGGWAPRPALGAAPRGRARLFILMVWDGLRPDSVTQADTPNLYALAHQGVYFADHHSIYPTQTMVNAAVLAFLQRL